MKIFLTSGKFGDIKESDFEALFAIIEMGGEVDFVEFASFIGQITGQIEDTSNDNTDDFDA